RPVLVTWRGVRVPAYPVMLYLGLLAGTYVTYGAGRAEGLPGQALEVAILALIGVAVLGARLAFVAGRRRLYAQAPLRIVRRGVEGGAVAYGGLLAVPVSLPLLAVLGLPVGSFWDAGAMGFLAAIVFLRIGCTLNGCCYGQVAGRIPTQLLEAGWA